MTRTLSAVTVLLLVFAACGDTASTTVGATDEPVATETPPPTTETVTTVTETVTTVTETTVAPETVTTTVPPPTEPPAAEVTDPAATLLDVWRTRRGTFVRFNDDATWTWEVVAGADPVSGGGYTLEEGVLTITTASGSFCEEGQTGVYEAAFVTADELSLTAISDECESRTAMADGTLLRHE